MGKIFLPIKWTRAANGFLSPVCLFEHLSCPAFLWRGTGILFGSIPRDNPSLDQKKSCIQWAIVPEIRDKRTESCVILHLFGMHARAGLEILLFFVSPWTVKQRFIWFPQEASLRVAQKLGRRGVRMGAKETTDVMRFSQVLLSGTRRGWIQKLVCTNLNYSEQKKK